MLRRAMAENIEVLAVHRQDQIEDLKIAGLDNSGPQRREVVPATMRRLARPSVRRLTNVIARGTRGIHLDRQFRSIARRDRAEDAFRGRRAADVTQTDEEDLHGATLRYSHVLRDTR